MKGKIFNKIKARFYKILFLEKEIVALKKALEIEKNKSDWHSEYYKAEERFKNYKDKVAKEKSEYEEVVKIHLEAANSREKVIIQLMSDMQKMKDDLSQSKIFEKEAKELLLETIKLNNALNIRTTKTEVVTNESVEKII